MRRAWIPLGVQGIAILALLPPALFGYCSLRDHERKVLRRTAHFEDLAGGRADVVFLGDSLSEGGLWSELLPERRVANRGVEGDTSEQVLRRLGPVIALRPREIFLLVGANDLIQRVPLAEILGHYRAILERLRAELPQTRVFVQSVLPWEDAWLLPDASAVAELNGRLEALASELGLPYVDLHAVFADADGRLRRGLSNDGIHLLPAGYGLWVETIRPLLAAGPR